MWQKRGDIEIKEEAVKCRCRKGLKGRIDAWYYTASSFSLSPADSSYSLGNNEMTTADVKQKEEARQ